MTLSHQAVRHVRIALHRVTRSRWYKHGHHASHMCYLALFALEHGPGAMTVLAVALILFATAEWATNGESE